MEYETIKHLRSLLSYSNSILGAPANLEQVTKIDGDMKDEIIQSASNAASVLLLLGGIGKTSKSIRQHCDLVDSNMDANESTDEGETKEFSQDISVETSKERKTFRVLMDVSNFPPKKVEVKIHEKYLVIHAKHEMVPDGHGLISREFTRKLEIPDEVDTETFRSLVDSYSVLTVEADFKQKEKVVESITLTLLKDPYFRIKYQPYEDKKKEFHRIASSHRKDSMEMGAFVRNFSELHTFT